MPNLPKLNYRPAYTLNHLRKPISKPLGPLMKLLEELDCEFLKFRWSFRGVPHIVLEYHTKTYSVCYFKKSRVDHRFKVFHPYPGGPKQNRENCGSPEEVIAFIRRRDA